MKAFSSRFVVAFDAWAVSAAALSRSLGGFRLRAIARRPLPEGALVPSAFEDNVVRPEEVRHALCAVAEELGIGRAGVCLVLPDGLARLDLLEVPAGIEAQGFARYRLLPGLPYPPEEAILDVLPVGERRVVAAAVRRSVVQGYEAVAASSGLVQERLDLAPLAALAALLRQRPGVDGIDLALGDVALSLIARAGGTVTMVRNRRRALGADSFPPDELEWLEAELRRTAAASGDGEVVPVRVVGGGGSDLVRELAAHGWPAEAGWQVSAEGLPVPTSELAWLGAAL